MMTVINFGIVGWWWSVICIKQKNWAAQRGWWWVV